MTVLINVSLCTHLKIEPAGPITLYLPPGKAELMPTAALHAMQGVSQAIGQNTTLPPTVHCTLQTNKDTYIFRLSADIASAFSANVTYDQDLFIHQR